MDKDEQNVMCCLLAKKLGTKHTIARIRNPEYASSISLLNKLSNIGYLNTTVLKNNVKDTASKFKEEDYYIAYKNNKYL